MLCFDVYWRDEKTGRVELDGLTILKNECYLDKDTIYPFMKYPFVYMTNAMQIYTWLEDRVIPRERVNIDDLLKLMGLKEYNTFDLLKKLHGSDYDDFVWMKFDDVPEDKDLDRYLAGEPTTCGSWASVGCFLH